MNRAFSRIAHHDSVQLTERSRHRQPHGRRPRPGDLPLLPAAEVVSDISDIKRRHSPTYTGPAGLHNGIKALTNRARGRQYRMNYTPPLREMQFVLHDVLDASSVLDAARRAAARPGLLERKTVRHMTTTHELFSLDGRACSPGAHRRRKDRKSTRLNSS